MTSSKQYDVFLSYKREDTEIMAKVRDALRADGIVVWTDESIVVADEHRTWSAAIDAALNNSKSLVLLASKASHGSEYVMGEIETAKGLGLPVFPMVIKDMPNEALPLEYRRAQYIDARDEKLEFGTFNLIKNIRGDTLSSQLNTELVTILARSEHIPKQLQTSNPLHWIVFLWLVYIQPNKLKIHQSNYGYDVYQEIANWLSSTLAWLPIFLVMFGAVLKPKLIFNATDFSVITPAGLCVFVIIAWIITGVKGVKQNNILFFIVFFAASSMTVLITGGTAVFVIGFMVYFIMRVFTYGLTVIAFGGIAVITLGVIIFLIVVDILHDIFNNVISGIPEIVALFLAIGVTDYVANIVISRFKSAKPIRFILIPLILAYGYLIWLYLLGGTSAIWDI